MVRFAGFAGIAASSLSGLFGSAAICALGVGPWNQFGIYWASAWLADAAGILTVIPVLALFASQRFQKEKIRNKTEFLVFLIVLFAVTQAVFGLSLTVTIHSLVYTLFPLLLWSAFRFPPHWAVVTALVVSVFSIGATLQGGGMFTGRTPYESLLLLQTYLVFINASGLILAAMVAERDYWEKELQHSNQLLDAILQIQRSFIYKPDLPRFFNGILEKILTLTESAYGFIGEVRLDEEGNRYLKSYATSDISWNEETKEIYDKNTAVWFEFKNLETLFGAVMKTGNPVISNDPQNDPRSGGLPPGHPPMNAFLAIPIFFENRMVGMLGIANRPGGYDPEMLAYLKPFQSTCGPLIACIRKERQRAEIKNRLDEKEALFNIIAEHIPARVAFIDPEGRYQYTNKAYERWFGLPGNQFVGKKVKELLGDEVFSLIENYFEAALSGDTQQFEMHVPYKVQGNRFVQCFLIPYKNSKGKVEGIVALLNDLTNLKQAEQQLKRYKTNLEQLVEQRTQELTEANRWLHKEIEERKLAEDELRYSQKQLRRLSERLRVVREDENTRIAREIHDEFGQMLTAFKLDLGWIRNKISEPPQPVAERFHSMVTHVEESLDRVRAFSSELRPQILDVLGLSEAVRWQARKFNEKTNIEYQIRIHPDPLEVDAGLKTDLFRILQEVLTNISRHAQAGEVKIDLEAGPNCYTLKIHDDGVGIDPSRLDHPDSLGILGIRERVWSWKGVLNIKGKPGVGTWVTVVIPRESNCGNLNN